MYGELEDIRSKAWYCVCVCFGFFPPRGLCCALSLFSHTKYIRVQVEKLSASDIKEHIKNVKIETRAAFSSMSRLALEDLEATLRYCEDVANSSHPASEALLDADRELAAATERTSRMIKASEALH